MASRDIRSLIPVHLREGPLRHPRVVTGMRSASNSVSAAIKKEEEESKKDAVAQSVEKPNKCHASYLACTCGHRVQLLRTHVSPCSERFSSIECNNMASEPEVIHSWTLCMECRRSPDEPTVPKSVSGESATDALATNQPPTAPENNAGDKASTSKAPQPKVDAGEEDWEEVGEPTGESGLQGEEDWILA